MPTSAIRFPWPYAPIFVHRCGGLLAPENTLEGLEVAARYGVGVEFDVMLNADDTPVLMHDDRLERTTDGRGRVSDTHDSELFSLDAGAYFAPAFRGSRVPRLSEALRRCRELGLHANVEIKAASPAAAAHVGRRVAQLLCAGGEAGEGLPPLLSSFDEAALEAAARHAPALPRGLLVRRLPRDWRERCSRLGVVSLHLAAARLTAEAVSAIRAAGLWVVVYTENAPARARRFFDWGVDCVITDRPDLLR